MKTASAGDASGHREEPADSSVADAHRSIRESGPDGRRADTARWGCFGDLDGSSPRDTDAGQSADGLRRWGTEVGSPTEESESRCPDADREVDGSRHRGADAGLPAEELGSCEPDAFREVDGSLRRGADAGLPAEELGSCGPDASEGSRAGE